MPPTPKASRLDIVTALEIWRGNVKGAASDLGITRKALYDRIQRMGLDLEDYRSDVGVTFSASGVCTQRGCEPVPTIAKCVPETQPANWSDQSVGAKLDRMMDRPGAVLQQIGGDLRQKAQQPARIKPEWQDKVNWLRLEIEARLKIDTTNTAIVEQFFKREFDGFCERILSYDPPHGGDNGNGAK